MSWILKIVFTTLVTISLNHIMFRRYPLGQTKFDDPVPQPDLVHESRVEDVSPQQEEQDTLKCAICSRENCYEDHESTFLFHEDQYKDHCDEEHIKLTQESGYVIGQPLTIFKEINLFKQLKTVTLIGMKLNKSSLSHLFQCTSIRSLKLSNCQLGTVPRSLSKLKDLEILDLSHNNLTVLPERPIRSLPCLKSVNVSHNRITVIGDVVRTLQALQHLDVSHNYIKKIPNGILEMKSLEAFSCNNNKIATWLEPSNAEVKDCTTSTLKFLDLSVNMLPDVPRHVKELKNLSVVNLSHNRIAANVSSKVIKQQIAELFYLPSVSALRLGNNYIKTLPQLDMARVSPNIKLVDLSNNKISEVPPTMLLMATLKVLLLGGNNITKLPTDLDLNNLSPVLRAVDLSDNSLKDLPLVLCFLRALEKLDLKGNKMTSISANLRSCKSLSFLNVSSNKLRELPSHVIGLPNLVEIHASNNLITSVGNLQRNELSVIEVIALAENSLSHFPAALIQMTKLKRVDLRHNDIKEIPQSIMDMPKDVTLTLEGNLIIDPPLQVCYAGLQAIQAFYEDLTTDSSITQCLKTLFLGTYEAGKTSLVRALQLNRSKLTKAEERTHGIEIAELHLSAPNTPDITLSVWDFAGQETYYITHQFFLSAKALVLLIVNLEKYDPDNFSSTCGNWMENMIAKVGNPVIIPVATHIDKLSGAEIKDRCENLAQRLDDQERIRIKDLTRQLERIMKESPMGSIEVVRDRKKQIESLLQRRPSIYPKPVLVSSAEPLKGIQYLEQVILNHSVNKEFFPEVGRPIPKAWADTEACVERKGEEMSFPYMTWDEFTSLLKENVPNLQPESRIQTVAQYLHDTGKILWYSEIESLRNHVFLKPASLVDIFRKVIRHDLERVINYGSDSCYKEAGITRAQFDTMKSDMVRKGILHTKLLRCLWSDVEKECRSGTFDGIFDVLIELMRQFDLCYDIEEQQEAFDTYRSQERRLLSWHEHVSESKTQHNISRRLLLPWHIKEDLKDRAESQWKSGKTPLISLQYQFPSFIPPGLFARLTVRAHRPEHNLHFVAHWSTGTLCKHTRSRILVLLKHEDAEGLVVSLSARPENLPYEKAVDTATRIMWMTLKEISAEMEDLLKQWPGVRYDRVTVCPMCHHATFPGNWLHPSSRQPEEDEVICTHCDNRVPVEFLVPSPPGRRPRHGAGCTCDTVHSPYPFDTVQDDVDWYPSPALHGYPYDLEQRFAGLNVSKPLSDKQLLRVAGKLDKDWESVAILMDFTRADVDEFKYNNPYNARQQKFAMLTAWRDWLGRRATGRRLQSILQDAGVDYDVISCLDQVERPFEWGYRAHGVDDFDCL